jgi:glycosyl transferase family 11
MIIATLIGGLGNQLFQYAAGRALAHKHGTQLKLDIDVLDGCPFRAYSLDKFNIKAEIATIRDILSLDRTEGFLRALKAISPKAHSVFRTALQKYRGDHFVARYYGYEIGTPQPPLLVKRVASQRLFNFDEDFFSLPDDVVLIGTWISYKYFEHIKPILLDELSVLPELRGRNHETARQIQSSQSVSVHVRRTDKVNHPEYFATDLEYVRQAMAFYEKLVSPIFYVFSDDISWCKINMCNKNTVFVDWNDDLHAYEDLRLMSLCKHNIVAESSFSWWGAYLNRNVGNLVITPPASRWVSRKNSLCKDILPPEWQVLG